MSEQPVLIPDANHPITIAGEPGRVRVFAGDTVVADSRDALVLNEANYPPVHYIPRVDVNARALTGSDTHTYCPYKGEADYHGLRRADGSEVTDKVWYYPTPHPAVGEIADHLAFYPDAVRIEVTPE